MHARCARFRTSVFVFTRKRLHLDPKVEAPRPKTESLTTFDRHIIRRLLSAYLFFVGALIVFFVVLHYVEYIDDFFDRGATMQDVFGVYYPNYIPEIVRLTSPLALFLSCIYLTGKLAQELQLVALQTGGVSLVRLLWPYALVGAVVTAGMFGFNGWVVPRTNATVLEFEERYMGGDARPIDISDIFRQNAPGNIISVGYYDRDTEVAHRVSLERFENENRLASRMDASRMEWVDSLRLWRMHTVIVRDFPEGGREERRQVQQLDTLLNVYPRDLARTERDVESMTIPVAADYVDALRRSGAGGLGRPMVAYYSKFAYPLANLILVLIAVPLAARRRRGGQAVRFGLGLLTAFAYLALQKLTEPFGYERALAPVLAAWLPHVLFALVAVVLVVRARK